MSLQELTEGRIDFVGQQLVDRIARIVLVAATVCDTLRGVLCSHLLQVVSFLAGFSLQSLRVTFSIFGGSAVLLALVVLPPWPMYNRHPVRWLPAIEEKEKERT
ncbi:hypothetical protein AX16_007862 [Volvariella volvacea WC 439]|nr:hypothetical protein AX16_007862 [Volvariella volvacea WC 439]